MLRPLSLPNRTLDRQDGKVECRKRQPKWVAHARLPFLGDPLIQQDRPQVVHPPTKDGQHRRRTIPNRARKR